MDFVYRKIVTVDLFLPLNQPQFGLQVCLLANFQSK